LINSLNPTQADISVLKCQEETEGYARSVNILTGNIADKQFSFF
jgi:hypothetical protein